MNNFTWISFWGLVVSQLLFPLVALGYTYELDLGTPVSEPVSRTEKIIINNCDNNQAEPYDLKDRLQVSQRLSFDEGWAISPGLEVSVPGVPVSLNLDTELSRTVGNELSIINETNRSLTGSVPAGVHKVIDVDIKDEIVRGTAVVSKKPSQWWERILPSDSWVTSSPYTAYGKRKIINIQYSNISCFAGKWKLDWSQWHEKPNSWGGSPIGGLAGGELIINDNGNVIIEYIFSYFNASNNRARYSIYCSEGSLDEKGLQGVMQPMFGSIGIPNQEYQELMNRYEDNDRLSSVYLTLCGRGKVRNTDQTQFLPFQVRAKTQANNRVIVLENHEIRSIWYQVTEENDN